MKVKELIKMLEELDPELYIYIAMIKGEETHAVKVQNVSESKDDDTIIGYLISNQPDDTPGVH